MNDPAWIALSLSRNLGGKTFSSLLSHFDNDLNAILSADVRTLQQVQGIGPKIARSIASIDLSHVKDRMRTWARAGVQVVTYDSPNYPPMLRQIPDWPPTLFYRGTLPDFSNAYAVVGSRKPTHQGIIHAERLGLIIAARGAVTVSGMAAGIDGAAHLGAVTLLGGTTVAVLGSGVLRPYPPEHERLANDILAQNGALISEVAPDAEVSAPGLVARNRLITGLSRGVFIVQTASDGGAMHAARFAQAQGIPVYVVQDPASGNQILLQSGCHVIHADLSNLPF